MDAETAALVAAEAAARTALTADRRDELDDLRETEADARRVAVKAELMRLLTGGGARPAYRPQSAPALGASPSRLGAQPVPSPPRDEKAEQFRALLYGDTLQRQQSLELVREERVASGSQGSNLVRRLRSLQRTAQTPD